MEREEKIFSSAAVVITRDKFFRGLATHIPYPLALLALALGFYILLKLPTPAGLSVAGHRAIAIFLLCLVMWLWGRIPLVITSLLAIIALPMAGVMKASHAYALFGNEAVFFILGAFILAAALMSTGLSSRIALEILERFGSTPRRLLLAIFLLNTGMAFFMSEHAVAAMTFPIIVELARALNLGPKQSRYGTAIFLAMAWGSSVGGIATFLGGARAALAVGILKQMTGKNISFFGWVVAAMPVTAALILVGLALIFKFFPIDVTSIQKGKLMLRAKNNKLGSLSYEEFIVGLVMIATICAWIALGENYGLANIALAAVVLLFALRAVKWKDIEQHVNWGIILMYGGAICLGAALSETGAAQWVAERTISRWTSSPALIILFMSFLAFALTEVMSHSAVVAALLPMAIPIGASAHIDARLIVFVIAIPAGLAFALPMGTPANAIAYSSGYMERRDMFIPGLIFGLLSWLIFNIIALLLWPILGVR
jgi:sodium-dependent dicarboxylate transporter 2/3/5